MFPVTDFCHIIRTIQFLVQFIVIQFSLRIQSNFRLFYLVTARNQLRFAVVCIVFLKFSFYKNKNNTKYYGASEYYKNTLSLPIYFGLKKKEQIHIIKSLFKFIKMYKRS